MLEVMVFEGCSPFENRKCYRTKSITKFDQLIICLIIQRKVVVMNIELEKQYSQTIKEYEVKEQNQNFSSLRMFNIEQHLKAKAIQLQHLHECFQNQIQEIQDYQRKQKIFRRIIAIVLDAFTSLKKQISIIKQQWHKVLSWKEDISNSISSFPKYVDRALKQNSNEENQDLVRSKVEVNQEKFKKIQMNYRQQIDKQNKMIMQLEEVLKRKSHQKRQSDVSQKKIHRQSTSIHLRSQNIQTAAYNNTSPLKEIKNIINACNKSIDKSINPHKKSTTFQKTLSKEEVVEKIRKYKQNKTIKQNYDALQKKASIVEKRPSLEIPPLPQLKTITNFKSPVSTGFDVLIIDGKEVYKGMWRKGMFEGRGKYYAPGWVYDGDFRNGIIDGFGTINFQNCTFIGKFENSKAQGEGTLYLKQKPISGIWRDNVLIKQY